MYLAGEYIHIIHITDKLLFQLKGVIDYELSYVIPLAMAERIKEVENADPNTVQKLGGVEFHTAFTMMSNVAAHHVRQAMESTAEQLGMWKELWKNI